MSKLFADRIFFGLAKFHSKQHSNRFKFALLQRTVPTSWGK